LAFRKILSSGVGEGKDKNIFFGFEAKIFHLVGIGPRKCGFPFFLIISMINIFPSSKEKPSYHFCYL